MAGPRSGALSLAIAGGSSLCFSTSGTIATPLLESGWSPTAAVLLRAFVAGLVLLAPALVALRGDLRPLWRARWRVIAYGGLGVVGTQLAYFAAIRTIPVGLALLIQYLAPLLLVGLAWVRTRRMPKPVVLIGSALSLAGLVLVIGIVGGTAAGGSLDPVGVLWALLAAVGLGIYFVLGARPDGDIPPIAFAGSSLLVGGVLLAGVAATGLLPVTVGFADVRFLGGDVPWWLPAAGVALLATALAYVLGVTGARRLGTRVASFLGLAEVLFSCVFAWLLLGQALSPLQLVGGVLILAGIVFVRSERPDLPVSPDTLPIPVTEPA
jgi:drug/metabolite transporter (DMT)-like permease